MCQYVHNMSPYSYRRGLILWHSAACPLAGGYMLLEIGILCSIWQPLKVSFLSLQDLSEP